MERVKLQYGKGSITVAIDAKDVTVLQPKFVEGLPDEEDAFLRAARRPLDCPPLKEQVLSGDRVAVVIPDNTRPLPSDRLLPWIFRELSHVPLKNFTVVIGGGTHRACTEEEIRRMVGAETAAKVKIVNHDARDPATLEVAGRTADGHKVRMNREYVEADRRILLGFIEPHFMAGFSGGYKAVFPGVADTQSIRHYHRYQVIGDPKSTWGRLEDNPTQEQIRANGSLLPVHFSVNVTLNRKRRITRFFCGDVIASHREGCSFVRQTAMVPCKSAFPVVVTSNSGHPLDQNLYQAVKGMSAAAQVVADGGFILAAAKCDDGFPEHGNFRKMLFKYGSPRAMLDAFRKQDFCLDDQWQVQLLALILLKARVGVHCEIDAENIFRAHMEPVDDITLRISEELKRIGRDAPVAVLPEGPMTIPYLQK